MINNNGTYSYCRWAAKNDSAQSDSIQTQHPVTWFQHGMKDIRKNMIQAQPIPGCVECKHMEQHSKISGRQRQLLKIGVNIDRFEKSLLSSPWFDEFEKTSLTDGNTDQLPQDWQINLGNYCNSACIFCAPAYSSRLASEYKKIGFINELPARAWCDDPALLGTFLETIEQTPNITYLHFIGGETLITPAFRIILEKLVITGLAAKITIGFTTNLTVWDHSVISLLEEFCQVNLGMSVECLHPLNDYVRYGSKLKQVEKILATWIDLARSHDWLMQLRVTPTVLSIWHLDTIYQFASQNGLSVESCNFLSEPAFLRPSVLPHKWRIDVISKLQCWIDTQPYSNDVRIVNTRSAEFVQQQLVNDARSHINYLLDTPDESFRLSDLTDYIHAIENIRGNSILNYLPEYEQILRPFGY